MPSKHDLLSRVVKRFSKPRDGDIYFFDSDVFEVEDLQRIQRHISKVAHPRARVLFIRTKGGFKQLSLRQLKNIVEKMEKYEDGAGDEPEND